MLRGIHCLVAAALALAACGGASGMVVVDVRDVSTAGDAPRVRKVTDLGDLGQVPQSGRLPALDSDGQFVVGELVLIEGEDFGKLPTVQIGGRPAAVEARTGGGGIVARIPPGVPTGAIDVEVSHPKGKHAVQIQVMRYALVVQPNEGKLHVLAVRGSEAPTKVSTLDMPGAQSVAYSQDGQAAYVLIQAGASDSTGVVAILVTTASGGPKEVRRLRIPMKRPLFLSAAASAQVLAVVDGNVGLMIDLQDPRNPANHKTFALQVGPQGAVPRAASLDASGRTLTLLVSEGNQLLPFDVSDPTAPVRATPLVAVPNVRHPVLRAFTYSPAGDQLWAVSGDTELSLGAGQHQTHIIAVDLQHGAAAPLSLKAPAPIAGADAPLVVASSRRETIAPGTSIRSTSKTAAVVVSTVHASMLALANKPVGEAKAETFNAVAEPATVLRTDLEGETQVLFKASGVVTGLAVSHDSALVAAATTRIVRTGGAFKLEFGVTFVPLAGGDNQYVVLGDVMLTAQILRPAEIVLAP